MIRKIIDKPFLFAYIRFDFWGCSSVGRALEWHSRGQGFDSPQLHHFSNRRHFGRLHTLEIGDKVTLTTKLGTRTYKVISVEKVNENDTSGLNPTSNDQITMYTCVRNQRDNRWKVVAVAN